MASTVPARILGLDGRKGRIAPGYDADLVALDEELEVVMTWVGGRMLHS
jgi:N-acetylglucosamine-6-phosphate deacetylase